MRIVNLGSLNLDRVYDVEHFARPGETISATGYGEFCGGKGLNQSVALARAGAEVYHLGAIGADGAALKALICAAGGRADFLQVLPCASGHAVIQVNAKGQNCIIVCGGANHRVTEAHVDEALPHFSAGDWLLVQNETSAVAYAMEKAKQRGLNIALNPSPITPRLFSYPLELVDLFILNEVEGAALAGVQSGEGDVLLPALAAKFPAAAIALTLGKQGAYWQSAAGAPAHHGIYDVPVVDTTAAGDTFCGYLLACMAKGYGGAGALHWASMASSLAVSRKGAAPSIPTQEEVMQFQQKLDSGS